MAMSEYENQVSQLWTEIAEIEKRRLRAEFDRSDVKREIDELAEGTRVRDRHRWGLWFNGDRAVYDRLTPLRDEIDELSRRIKDAPRARAAKEEEIRGLVVAELERNDLDHRRNLAERDKGEAHRKACARVLDEIAKARARVQALQRSASGNPEGRSARMRVDRDAGDLTARFEGLREQVVELKKKIRTYGSIDDHAVDITFSGSEVDHAKRRLEYNRAIQQLGQVASRITTIRGKIDKNLKALEKRRAEAVRAEVNRLRPPGLGSST
jgi:chromosome segregation ATPase